MSEETADSRGPARQLPEKERRALGSRIVQLRRDLRWSQRELGRRSGIRYMRLCRLEKGHVTPSLPELLRIAGALGTGLDAIALGTAPEISVVRRYLLPPLVELEETGSPEEHALVGKLLRVLVAGFRAMRPDGEQA